VNSDGYFTRFGISSPTLWWENEKLLNQAVTQINENKTNDLPQTKVFISVGEKEGPTMVSTMFKYSKYLEYRNYDNINLQWQIFEKETHKSAVAPSIYGALSVLLVKMNEDSLK
jgi:predicted alpha/beta superfamily hydrolase